MSFLARPALCRPVAAAAGGRGGLARRVTAPTAWVIRHSGPPSTWKNCDTSRSRFSRTLSTTAKADSSSNTVPSQPPSGTPTGFQTPPPKPRRIRRAFIFLTLTTLSIVAGFTMTAATTISDSMEVADGVLAPPTDEESLTLFKPTTSTALEIEAQIMEHPLTQSLFKDPKFTASRPHMKIPERLRAQTLMGGPLLGPDKVEVPPLQFATEDGSEFVSLQYLGRLLCGHPRIVHGGLLATLLDEGTARCCFPALPNKVAVTASLKLDYKKPCMAGQIVVLRAVTTKVEGRKAWVKGHIETLADESKGEKPVVLVEAEALFIEPRGAEKMKNIVVA